MPKSAFSREYRALCRLLRECRLDLGLTQADLSQQLGRPQSFVSKYEVGERRLDVVELSRVCHSLGLTLGEFVNRFEKCLGRNKKLRIQKAGERSNK
jgi:transcriptional regulator with XRE-family HTH domain